MNLQKIWTHKHDFSGLIGQMSAIGTMIEVFEEREINEFEFFSFLTPSSTMMIAEKHTGAIVSCTFEDVAAAMQGIGRQILQGQLDTQVEIGNSAEMMSNEEFFDYYQL